MDDVHADADARLLYTEQLLGEIQAFEQAQGRVAEASVQVGACSMVFVCEMVGSNRSTVCWTLPDQVRVGVP